MGGYSFHLRGQVLNLCKKIHGSCSDAAASTLDIETVEVLAASRVQYWWKRTRSYARAVKYVRVGLGSI